MSQTNSYITTCTKHICSRFSGDLADIIKIAYGHGKEQNCIDLSFSDVAYPKVIDYNTNEDEVADSICTHVYCLDMHCGDKTVINKDAPSSQTCANDFTHIYSG